MKNYRAAVLKIGGWSTPCIVDETTGEIEKKFPGMKTLNEKSALKYADQAANEQTAIDKARAKANPKNPYDKDLDRPRLGKLRELVRSAMLQHGGWMTNDELQKAVESLGGQGTSLERRRREIGEERGWTVERRHRENSARGTWEYKLRAATEAETTRWDNETSGTRPGQSGTGVE